jgi:uncharacterized membrane protein YphA (DoxX/SURF4 family)
MTITEPRRSRTVLSFARRAVLTLAGVIVALFCYFVCQGMFSGYRQYGTNILSYIGLFLICATGGLAWILDHRRIRDDDE